MAGSQVSLTGKEISSYSRAVIFSIAQEAKIKGLIITSVKRTVKDQARIFYDKHVVGKTAPRYKNPGVQAIVDHAKVLVKRGRLRAPIINGMVKEIDKIHGGPGSVSRHISSDPMIEVFDIAHWTMLKGKRHNYLTNDQAKAFLNACRRRLGKQIVRLGHSKELGFSMPQEFSDEKCFHFEIRQPILENLIQSDNIA